LNQNRNQNRRRGRGSNRGQGGGGNPGNRIDSRARGNAPQMLEKYKKLAHDASLNGDRVQTEYYLQFADHYFRVVAEMRSQKDDQRPRHDRDRDQPFDAEDYDSEQPRRDRYEEERQDADEGQRAAEGEADEAGAEEATADDNPFTRDARGPKDRGDRNDRGGERDRPRGRGRGRPANDASDDEPPEAVFDPGLLPPSISREDDAPRPARTRTRRPRPADDEGDEALEAAS